MNEYKIISKCLCCDSEVTLILDLNEQPLANSYHTNTVPQNTFPLALNLCKTCGHLQLTHAVDPDLMFSHYLYVSGTSTTLLEYFDWFAKYTLDKVPHAKTVLDVASNDGSQLNSYKKLGMKTHGIDPAKNLADIPIEAGHNIVVDYLTFDSVKQFGDIKFDIITAQNVFAHNVYPLEFLRICKSILSDDGIIFIQTSQANMIQNNEFDTIYHEHISFFNPVSMHELVTRAGLYLVGIEKTPIHGTSFIFVISKTPENQQEIQSILNSYKTKYLRDMSIYTNYANNARSTVQNLDKLINNYKRQGYNVIGYGAAAKGMTVLNFGKLYLDYIVDDNPLKQNLYTPGTNILIKSPQLLTELPRNIPMVIIPLAWNFYDEIYKKVLKYRHVKNDIFVKYFPEITETII